MGTILGFLLRFVPIVKEWGLKERHQPIEELQGVITERRQRIEELERRIESLHNDKERLLEERAGFQAKMLEKLTAIYGVGNSTLRASMAAHALSARQLADVTTEQQYRDEAERAEKALADYDAKQGKGK